MVSYTAVSPLPAHALAVCFLWHCPAGHPGWLLATTLRYGARTFLGTGFPATRPPSQLIRASSVARRAIEGAEQAVRIVAAVTHVIRSLSVQRRRYPAHSDACVPTGIGAAIVWGVLILLPPSEGKTAPAMGSPVNLAALSHPALEAARKRVGNELARASARRNALSVLDVGASLTDEVARNTSIWENPTAPASQVYSGVLYEASGAATWTGDTLERAADRVRVISALWGAVSPADAIPAYRLSMGTTLSRLGPLAAFWRGHLGKALDERAAEDLIVDCRSSTYAAAWRAPKHAVSVRVEREANGKRTVVSHNAKHARGLLTGLLVAEPEPPSTAEQLADIAGRVPGVTAVELRPGTLTLVTNA